MFDKVTDINKLAFFVAHGVLATNKTFGVTPNSHCSTRLDQTVEICRLGVDGVNWAITLNVFRLLATVDVSLDPLL